MHAALRKKLIIVSNLTRPELSLQTKFKNYYTKQ